MFSQTPRCLLAILATQTETAPSPHIYIAKSERYPQCKLGTSGIISAD